eukprot:801233-Heterocapsa_arctica.AAC.1
MSEDGVKPVVDSDQSSRRRRGLEHKHGQEPECGTTRSERDDELEEKPHAGRDVNPHRRAVRRVRPEPLQDNWRCSASNEEI